MWLVLVSAGSDGDKEVVDPGAISSNISILSWNLGFFTFPSRWLKMRWVTTVQSVWSASQMSGIPWSYHAAIFASATPVLTPCVIKPTTAPSAGCVRPCAFLHHNVEPKWAAFDHLENRCFVLLTFGNEHCTYSVCLVNFTCDGASFCCLLSPGLKKP